ncbi:hypothetical protein BGZ65_001326 [Modicella reniformis]|uniref:Uncharacterized protein n=1 Tax=Modicella reniformis TaxID=1440133 RepID=A0A9P6SU85_9FUNG|nr:hypothetical protein BGZ65_001326 [Modicella reniformis]
MATDEKEERHEKDVSRFQGQGALQGSNRHDPMNITANSTTAASLMKDDDSSYYGQNFRPRIQVLLPPIDTSSSSTNAHQDPYLLLSNCRPDTPEPWKASAWIDSRSTNTGDSDLEQDRRSLATSRSATSQFKGDISPMTLGPAVTATVGGATNARIKSPSVSAQKQLHNTEDPGASPISLAVPSLSYPHHRRHKISHTNNTDSYNKNNSNVNTNSSNNNNHSISSRGTLPASKIYDRNNDHNPDTDSQPVVVGEASRVMFDYRTRNDTDSSTTQPRPQHARPQILTIDEQQSPLHSLSPAPRRSSFRR